MADISKIVTTSGDSYDIKDAIARTDLELKAPKANPVFTGSISLGRTSGTNVGSNSVALGSGIISSGYYTFAEGYGTTSSGIASHAEGWSTIAKNTASHAMGMSTVANGNYSLVFGKQNVPDSINNFPLWEANTYYKVGDIVRRSDGYTAYCKTAHTSQQTYNADSNKWEPSLGLYKYVEIVGNCLDGVSSHVSNARALDWHGNEHLNGDLYIKCNSDSSNGIKVSDGLLSTTDRTKLNNLKTVSITYNSSDDCIEVAYT